MASLESGSPAGSTTTIPQPTDTSSDDGVVHSVWDASRLGLSVVAVVMLWFGLY